MDHIKKRSRERNPREKANIISLITFFYTWKLFKKGTKQELEQEDLYEVLPTYRSKKLGDQFEEEWEIQKTKRGKNSILRLLITCYGLEILVLGISRFIVTVIMVIVYPHALSQIISYFNPEQIEMTKTDLYFWAALLLGCILLEVIYGHNYYFAVVTLGIRIRAAFCSFIYRKALKLGPSRLAESSIGKIVTLMTKDVPCLGNFSHLFNDAWIALLKTAIICYIVYRKIGIAAFAGVGFFLFILPLQIYMATWAAKLQMKMCRKIDERLQITQETLSAVKIIKMYTWEKFFTNKIVDSRKKEIRSLIFIYHLRFVILQIGALSGSIAFYLLIMTYKWLGNHVTAEIVYYIFSCFLSLTWTLAGHFPMAISKIAEVTASVKRIGNVLKALEIEEELKENNLVIKPKVTVTDLSVTFKGKEIIHSINVTVDMGVTLITGPVGSGKSFLLKTILREYVPTNGTVITQGRISYASQEPWLFPSSIKQNILFGETYDEARYQEVLKVCALIYDFDLLAEGDSTIVEDRGNNLSKGQQARVNLARAVYKDCEIYLLDDCLSALDSQVSDFIFRECIKKFLKNKMVIFVSHNMSVVEEVDHVIVMRHGTIRSHAKAAEISETELIDNENEKLSNKLSEELDEVDEETKLITETVKETKVYQEVKKEGEVDFDVYKKYLQFGGGVFAFFLIILIYGVFQFVQSYSDKLVSEWVNIEQEITNITLYNNTNITITIEKRDYTLKLYTIMIILATVFGLTRIFVFYAVVRRVSINLHKSMIRNIVNATMQFFDQNYIGNILNRFSKDLALIDEQLPFIYHHVFRTVLLVLGIMTLIATVNAVFLLPTFLFFATMMVIRRYYLRTARSLKRLDAITRSPVVGHLNATLEGLTTIRAFQAETILRDEFDRHQDAYTSASYICENALRAFAFTLNILSSMFIALVIGRFVFWNDDFLAGSVGLAISQAFRMTWNLQWGVEIWSEMENSMTSVERVLEYTEVKQETSQGQILEDWPRRGEVRYENVYLSYNNRDFILKNINFTANPREKIGIIGRTGAGKSSIISTLFRLYEIEGKITIDGVDTKLLSLDFLRKHVSIIPQDPVLFTGTIRDNIDPEKSHTDDEIWDAIETAHLKKLIPALDYPIPESGSCFSLGQRQLICVARAIIRNNKIVVLDEATANMDTETDTLIHETIGKCFVSCTVFTIAHKLHSIINCDKVIVMDKGEIAECGDPKSLLQNEDGYFHQMAKKSGFLSPNKL